MPAPINNQTRKITKMSDYIEDFDDLGMYVPDANQLKSLEELINQAAEISRTVEELEQAVKKHKEELTKLTHAAIPDAMSAAGTTSFTTTAGVKVSIKEVLAGTLPKEEPKRTAALRWLEDHGGKDIIKSTLTAEFEKGGGNLEKKNRAAEALADMGVVFIDAETVHPMTLAAFARERLKNGEEVPLEDLGLYSGRMAKITRE